MIHRNVIWYLIYLFILFGCFFGIAYNTQIELIGGSGVFLIIGVGFCSLEIVSVIINYIYKKFNHD